MDFTGERVVPTQEGFDSLHFEHVARYRFASTIARGRTVLDAGCGCGYGSFALMNSGASEVIGLDSSVEAIDFARERYSVTGLRFDVGDVRATGLADGAFDLITSFEVFEHINAPDLFLEETARLLSPGGLLVVSTPNADHYVAGGEDGTNPFHVREYTADEFRWYLEAVFPHVRFYVQAPAAGNGILPAIESNGAPTTDIRASLIPSRTESDWGAPIPVRSTPAKGSYLIALCSPAPIEDHMCPPGHWFVPGSDLASTESGDLGAMYRTIQQLESELASRTRWARDMEKELAARDETVRSLQTELEDRSRWALELAGTVKEQEETIADLQKNTEAAPGPQEA